MQLIDNVRGSVHLGRLCKGECMVTSLLRTICGRRRCYLMDSSFNYMFEVQGVELLQQIGRNGDEGEKKRETGVGVLIRHKISLLFARLP